MIVSAFLALAYFFLNGLINLLPVSTGFPQGVHDAMIGLGGYLGIFSPLVPIETLIYTVSTIFIVDISLFGFRTLKWIGSHIPWIGGKGN